MTYHSNFFKLFLALGVIVAGASCNAVPKGKSFLVNIDDKGVIMEGYDPVAYFTDNKPVKGNANIKYTWHDATYQFSTEEHKKLFESNPEKYAPQYGGYCGYAASLGRLAPAHGEFWEIRDGRLILQYNQRALEGWQSDPLSLQKADKYWPEILAKSGKPKTRKRRAVQFQQ